MKQNWKILEYKSQWYGILSQTTIRRIPDHEIIRQLETLPDILKASENSIHSFGFKHYNKEDQELYVYAYRLNRILLTKLKREYFRRAKLN